MNKRLYLYSSLFIALVLNVPKLFALRKMGMIAQYWHFNFTELCVQTVLNFCCCLAIYYYSANRFETLFAKDHFKEKTFYIVNTIIITVAFSAVGIAIQRTFFSTGLLYGGGVFLRLLFSVVLIFIELRIVMILQLAKNKEIENEQLRNAFLRSELEVLKGQLNPHFFFNALSSLSAIVRENPPLAQDYISHLSKSFRYSLHSPANGLSVLGEEIAAARSYAALMKMRYEKGFEIEFLIASENDPLQLPHMSLQPLIENAIKHNSISADRPLKIEVSLQDHILQVKNNLQPAAFPQPGDGIGLANLNERYKILMHQEIQITKDAETFTVQLPVK